MQNVLVLLFLVGGLGSVAKASENTDAFYEELASETLANPFKKPIPLVDPLSKAGVDRVLTGPVYKAKKGADFDYYRYVTFYNVDGHKERIYSLPSHREDCYDDSEIFAGWSYTYSFTAKVTVGIQFEGLGLSTDFSQTHTLTTSRNLKGHGKIIADHTPYLYKQNWEGLTYIQTVNTKTGKEEIVLKQENGRVPAWLPILFPALAPKPYPMSFEVEDADWTFVVERTVLGQCPGNGDGKKSTDTRSSASKNTSVYH